MNEEKGKRLIHLIRLLSKPHPWHGITIGENAPREVKVFIEIVPGDTMKYELDKTSGYLMVDRPQRFSNIIPVPYGFIPQTLCDRRTAEYCMEKTGRKNIKGDNDPLDICVVTERSIPHGDLIVDAIPVGGLRMIDGNEADDKIIAVLKGDALYGEVKNIDQLPENLIDRLSHYFLTYKQMPYMEGKKEVEITHEFGKDEALEVIRRSMDDYEEKFNIQKEELLSFLEKRDLEE
ncbi:MAG: inorganic pyrophosphatase [Balneolaceae bacterium]|nr:inorganic pyrophosphatase [Balneolaceae bacterium]